MNFTLRQWAILAGLSAVFLVAAVLVSNNDGSGTVTATGADFDEVVWCEAANAISRWGGILDGSVDGDRADDVVNLENALRSGIEVAPVEFVPDFRRLIDFTMIVQLKIDSEPDLATAFDRARGNTDVARVEAAVARLDVEITGCGHPAVGA